MVEHSNDFQEMVAVIKAFARIDTLKKSLKEEKEEAEEEDWWTKSSKIFYGAI